MEVGIYDEKDVSREFAELSYAKVYRHLSLASCYISYL